MIMIPVLLDHRFIIGQVVQIKKDHIELKFRYFKEP